MSERVLVIGAGMAGLWSAMALASPDREITVLDRRGLELAACSCYVANQDTYARVMN